MSIYISPDSAAWSLTSMAAAASAGSIEDVHAMANLVREIYETEGVDALSGVVFALAHHHSLSLHALATATGIPVHELLEMRRHQGSTFHHSPSGVASRFDGLPPGLQASLEPLQNESDG
ncbi:MULTISPECIES: hypothetical protein [Arthrobacter]|uniref:Uncharacterized protein n=1 Tax=Arthrobacter terricola TaxID=2547396 RepID=A0A4R5KHP7_9MICC|nr:MULTISPECIES: hypothetical protein [Arthrobacter]MBT8162016.1 hypothetical protein [Arthrobacter sp. GN70]TDF94592.1 hypothetical protein E1809_13665 [Arthrobacter terricola]